MHKRISPHGDFDHMGETINLFVDLIVKNVNCSKRILLLIQNVLFLYIRKGELIWEIYYL